MAHRAEDILIAVAAAVTGLTTTGANVFRSKVYEYTDDTLPGLTVNQAQDDLAEEGDDNLSFIDRELTVEITSHIKLLTTLDTELNKIRREVWVAMLADRTLGLAYVIDVRPLGDNQPEHSADLEKPVATQALFFLVKYRHSLTDPGA